jgi:hypothetical protein
MPGLVELAELFHASPIERLGKQIAQHQRNIAALTAELATAKLKADTLSRPADMGHRRGITCSSDLEAFAVADAAREQIAVRLRLAERAVDRLHDELAAAQRTRAIQAALGAQKPRIDPVPDRDVEAEYQTRLRTFVRAFRDVAIASEELIAVCTQRAGQDSIGPPRELRAFDEYSVFSQWMTRALAAGVVDSQG